MFTGSQVAHAGAIGGATPTVIYETRALRLEYGQGTIDDVLDIIDRLRMVHRRLRCSSERVVPISAHLTVQS